MMVISIGYLLKGYITLKAVQNRSLIQLSPALPSCSVEGKGSLGGRGRDAQWRSKGE